MNPNAMKYGMIAAMAGLAGCGEVNANEQNTGALNTKETVVTNSDGSVTTTKREEREIKDDDGNVIGHESSVYTETVSADVAAARKKGDAAKAPAMAPTPACRNTWVGISSPICSTASRARVV